jgi:hypothetical protein
MKNTEDLSFVADVLLAIVGPDSSAPFEFDILPRKKASGRQLPAFVLLATCQKPDDELLAAECMEIFRRAELTECQAEVLDMRLLGLTFDQIGVCKGRSRQGVMSVFLQAVKKIGRVMRVYPYTGLSDVYRHEIRRGVQIGAFGRIK